MRIIELTIEGFGGVSGELGLDLDSDVVILAGANGYGKTTICNAISWVISGVSESSQGPRNLYNNSGATAVGMRIELNGENILISRFLENPGEDDPKKLKSIVQVCVSDATFQGDDAEAWLRGNLIASDSEEDFQGLAQSFVESMYLKQESLRDFLTGREDIERFKAVANMVGAGRLQAFVDALQSQKRAWARAINQDDAMLEVDRAKLEDLSVSLSVLEAELTRLDVSGANSHWSAWRREAEPLAIPELCAPEIAELNEESLVKARTSLLQDRSFIEQRNSYLISVQAELSVALPESPSDSELLDVETAVNKQKDITAELKDAVEDRRAAINAADMERQKIQSAREELANMATILLRHVGDTCAACGQKVEREEFESRLERIANEAEDHLAWQEVEAQRQELNSLEEKLAASSAVLGSLETQLLSLRERHARARAALANRESRISEVVETLSDVSVETPEMTTDVLALISLEIERLRTRRASVDRLLESAQEFDAVASLEASKSRRIQLQSEKSHLSDRLVLKQKEIEARRNTNDVAGSLLDAVKADAETFVSERLNQLMPLLRQFYAAIDPHPTFRSIDIATRVFGGKHRLAPVLRDDEANVEVKAPGDTLSTSQANALAVSIFLAFNLGFAPSSAQSLILDDPLQNLDDVHLLGLVDLLRKIIPHRQLIITTHDHSFASLLARKLRPVREDFRTTYIRFTKWDRTGPGIERWDMPTEQNPMKLVRS